MQKRVLIADDEPQMRNSLGVIIRRMGHIPFCAENGSEALNLLVEHHLAMAPLDLLLCDLQMPVLTGEELIFRMLQRKIPTHVLVITGIADKGQVVRLMRLGIRDFIDKPFTPEEIQVRMADVLEHIESETAETNRSRYLARLGEIARASVHDINNVIGATIGYTDLLLERTDGDDVMHRYLRRISRSAGRITEICHELLSINPQEMRIFKVKTDLNCLVRKIADVLTDVLPSSITVTARCCSYPLWYDADAGLLQHAFLNLGFNAADAMPGGGAITLSVAKKGDGCGGTFIIDVEDTGSGIPSERVACIFDEGFTTKEGGHGIGLANVCRIVKEHDGRIEVASEVGKGTCFRIVLPSGGRGGHDG